MNRLFADTSFYLALLNPRDRLHTVAVELSQSQMGRIVTSDFVLIETGNALGRSTYRPMFVSLLDRLEADKNTHIVPATRELYRRGLELYRTRLDKEWSLTDCTSFVIMNAKKLDRALTADHHFQQAGFIALMRS